MANIVEQSRTLQKVMNIMQKETKKVENKFEDVRKILNQQTLGIVSLYELTRAIAKKQGMTDEEIPKPRTSMEVE